jgi:putative transposase
MSRPPRLAGFDYVGRWRYFLTICTDRRQRHFLDPDLVHRSALQFLQCGEESDIEVTAYCFMPDHLHVLATGMAAESDVRLFVHVAKQRTAWAFKRIRGARLWQEGFHDRVLREEEPTEHVVAYLINNPLRAGLALRVEDYPFWGSGRYTREQIIEFVAGP